MGNVTAYFFVFCTVLLTVCGQFLIKWQVLRAGNLPAATTDRISFIFHLLINPWVIAAILSAFLASVTWMLAMTKLELSHAYPLTALTFVLVVIGGAALFSEPLTAAKLSGLAFVVLGIIVGSRG